MEHKLFNDWRIIFRVIYIQVIMYKSLTFYSLHNIF